MVQGSTLVGEVSPTGVFVVSGYEVFGGFAAHKRCRCLTH